MVTKPRQLPENKMLWQIIIDRKLHRGFKVDCAKEGISMSARACELIAKYLKRQSKKSR